MFSKTCVYTQVTESDTSFRFRLLTLSRVDLLSYFTSVYISIMMNRRLYTPVDSPLEMQQHAHTTYPDVEKGSNAGYRHLTNNTVRTFSWENVTVTVKDRQTKRPKKILSGVNGVVKAGMFLRTSRSSTRHSSSCRRVGRLNGSKWIRENNITQRIGPSRSYEERHRRQDSAHQRQHHPSAGFSKDQLLCRAGGCSHWRTHGSRDNVLCCQTVPSKVS